MVTSAKKLKTRPFDASIYLDDAEGQADLLNDALQSGHAGYVADALGIIARARGMSELARMTGIGRASLYKALDADGNPTLETFLAVLDALKVELTARPKDSSAEAA